MGLGMPEKNRMNRSTPEKGTDHNRNDCAPNRLRWWPQPAQRPSKKGFATFQHGRQRTNRGKKK